MYGSRMYGSVSLKGSNKNAKKVKEYCVEYCDWNESIGSSCPTPSSQKWDKKEPKKLSYPRS